MGDAVLHRAQESSRTIVARDTAHYAPATVVNGELGFVIGREPFRVFAETATSDSSYFMTGAGGLLQAVLFGFGGLEIRSEDWWATIALEILLKVRRFVS